MAKSNEQLTSFNEKCIPAMKEARNILNSEKNDVFFKGEEEKIINQGVLDRSEGHMCVICKFKSSDGSCAWVKSAPKFSIQKELKNRQIDCGKISKCNLFKETEKK